MTGACFIMGGFLGVLIETSSNSTYGSVSVSASSLFDVDSAFFF
jgi:hypothetical protein